MLVARACATKNEGDWQKCKRDWYSDYGSEVAPLYQEKFLEYQTHGLAVASLYR